MFTLLLFGSQLEATDMQFGFISGHSTVMCSLIFKDIVDHYLHHGSIVKTDVPRSVIRPIFDSYIRQKACATWNKQMSKYFTLENRVKQGGVISSIFFSIYIKTVFIKFRN